MRPELLEESDPEREREREGDSEYDRSRLRPIIALSKGIDLEQATETSQTWYNTQVHSTQKQNFFCFFPTRVNKEDKEMNT